jgi:hypothetical protein
MAPMLYHGLSWLGLPVVCVESRQAYQALKSLATHKTDRNDARGLAHLARTGFFKPVHVKSLPAHAIRALIIAIQPVCSSLARARRNFFSRFDRSPGQAFCGNQRRNGASRVRNSANSSV